MVVSYERNISFCRVMESSMSKNGKYTKKKTTVNTSVVLSNKKINLSDDQICELLDSFEREDELSVTNTKQSTKTIKNNSNKHFDKPNLRRKNKIDYDLASKNKINKKHFMSVKVSLEPLTCQRVSELSIKNKDNVIEELQRLPIYRQEANIDNDEEIRPSQVFEFQYDPTKETIREKKFKKEAKVIKKMLRDKVRIQHKHPPTSKQKIPGKSSKNKRIHELKNNENIEKLENIQTAVSPVRIENNATKPLLSVADISNVVSNDKVPKLNSKEKTPDLEIINDEINESQNIYIPDMSSTGENNKTVVEEEISKICEDFDELCTPNTSSVNNTSIPWRLRIPVLKRRVFFNVKDSSLPSYNQDMILKPLDFESTLNVSSNSTEINNENSKKIRQTSMLSYIKTSNNIATKSISESVELFNDTSLINSPPHPSQVHIDKNTLNSIMFPPTSTVPSVKNSEQNDTSASSISDISVMNSPPPSSPVKTDNENISEIDKVDKPREKRFSTRSTRVSFKNAITSSPSVQNNSSRRILGEKNIYSNKSTNRITRNSGKENINISQSKNLNTKKSPLKTNPLQESFRFSDITKSTEEIVNRSLSKRPVRISPNDIKKFVETNKLTEENKTNEVTEQMNEDIPPVNNDFSSIVTSDNEDITCEINLFDEPRFSRFDTQSLSDKIVHKYTAGRKRKRLISEGTATETEDEDVVEVNAKKRKKKTRPKKEDIEFDKWASQFNEMCKEVEKEELFIE